MDASATEPYAREDARSIEQAEESLGRITRLIEKHETRTTA
jgi:hypothetical protein